MRQRDRSPLLLFLPALRFPVLVAGAVFLVQACATVPETRTVDPAGPEVSPVLEQGREHHLKRRVAIARFSNETLYGKSRLLTREADFVTGQAADMLSTRLGESRQFVLVEVTDRDSLLAALDDHRVDDLGIAADYVIIGSLAEFGRETVGESGFMSRTKIQRAYARVNVRLVDVRSSEVLFATEGTGEAETESGTVVGIGTKQGYDSTLNDKAISAAVTAVANNLQERLLEQPWRSYVLGFDGEELIIAGGRAEGVRPGDRFAVMERGRLVDNPRTGRAIELPRQQVAVIEVASLLDSGATQDGSLCRLVSGAVSPDDLTRYVVQEIRP